MSEHDEQPDHKQREIDANFHEALGEAGKLPHELGTAAYWLFDHLTTALRNHEGHEDEPLPYALDFGGRSFEIKAGLLETMQWAIDFNFFEALGEATDLKPEPGTVAYLLAEHLNNVLRDCKDKPLPYTLDFVAGPFEIKAGLLKKFNPRQGAWVISTDLVNPKIPAATPAAKRWTPDKLEKLMAYRKEHGTKKAAAWAGIAESRVRKLLPADEPPQKGYSAFNSHQK